MWLIWISCWLIDPLRPWNPPLLCGECLDLFYRTFFFLLLSSFFIIYNFICFILLKHTLLWIFSSTIEWNTKLKELKFSYEDSNKFSQSPWQIKSKTQIVQILWADKDIMVTRQPSDKLSSPDLYTLWKRMKPVIYNKY
jgi:hypothetical protein